MPGCCLDFSSRTKFRVTGSDRVRFINGQTTSDARKLNASAAQESCVLNAKGHLQAHIFLFASEDAVWIDADESLREALPTQLERYLIADDVAIEDVTEQYRLFHALAVPPGNGTTFRLTSCRLGIPGHDFWCKPAEASTLKEALDCEFLDENAGEVLRVENGIPRWGRELTPELIPLEANLERAIDYEKGCYIGQEVISRMKMSGQVRQKLCGVTGDAELDAGMELRANGKTAGKITSAVFSLRFNAHIGLAVLKRGFTEPGTQLDAGQQTVRVSELPFTIPADEQIRRGN